MDRALRVWCHALEENSMKTVRRSAGGPAARAALAALATLACLAPARAQTPATACRSAQVIPLPGTEPGPKITVDAPLADPLASRGVVVITYCAENMRLEPMFGPGALTISPRVGHVHVTVDDAPWHWADASGNPLILRGLPPGRHKVLIELVDANHQVVDKGSVTFEVPDKTGAPPPL
jgi:hypothetical protein